METLDEIKEKIKTSTDNEYILESLKANEKLQADRDVMLAAVKVDGQALYYGSKEIRNDKEIVSGDAGIGYEYGAEDPEANVKLEVLDKEVVNVEEQKIPVISAFKALLEKIRQ